MAVHGCPQPQHVQGSLIYLANADEPMALHHELAGTSEGAM